MEIEFLKGLVRVLQIAVWLVVLVVVDVMVDVLADVEVVIPLVDNSPR